MSILELFITFFCIGLFTIGGGVVAITLMQQLIVDKGIISTEMFYNMVAISESTPGPLGTNMATYIGFNQHGVIGAIVATLAEALPSVIIILIIAHFLVKFNQSPFVKGALGFLRPVTTGIILVPGVHIFFYAVINRFAVLNEIGEWKNLINWMNLAIYEFFTFLLFKFKLHPIIIILMGAAFGMIFL